MSNPFTDLTALFQPTTTGNFIRCFDAAGCYWLAFVSVERVYARDEDVYVSTSAGDELLVARLPTEDQVEQALISTLQALSTDEEKENADN